MAKISSVAVGFIDRKEADDSLTEDNLRSSHEPQFQRYGLSIVKIIKTEGGMASLHFQPAIAAASANELAIAIKTSDARLAWAEEAQIIRGEMHGPVKPASQGDD